MKKTSIDDLLRSELKRLRGSLNNAFSKDTAHPEAKGDGSCGHCAAVSAIVREMFGGEFVSTRIDGESHWFNRISVSGKVFDVDLTGDQFGFEPVRIYVQDAMYADSKVRSENDLDEETRHRACLLARRAGLSLVAQNMQDT